MYIHLLHLEDEALSVSNVEEEVANDGGGLAVDELQARSEPVVARAVHHLPWTWLVETPDMPWRI